MTEKIAEDINILPRIRLLMIFRAACVTFLLGIAVFMDIQEGAYVAEVSIPHFYGVVLAAYILSVLYLVLYEKIQDYRINIYTQTFCDILVITALVYVTGGIRSIYTVLYPLVIIYSVLFLGRNGGLLSASGCSILYGLLIDFEYLGVISPPEPYIFQYASVTTSFVFLRILIHIFSFYVIAALASFVVEREKQVRVLLAEKESAFNRLDRLYRSIVESIDAGILTIDLEGRIKSFNRGAEEITGFTFDEIENREFRTIFPSWSALYGQIRRHTDGEVPGGRIELPFIGKDDRKLILGCSVSSLKEAGGGKIGDIVIFQDLTQIKQMEEAVAKSRRLAFIGEMAASLAHELRNPLASISGSIQMLRRDLTLRVSDERLMQIILRGKDQLESFIKDFLLLARQKQRQEEEFDLNDVVNEVLDSLKLDYDWHETIEVERNVPRKVIMYANKTEIRQVILNLVLNAIQAMPDGGRLVVETNVQEERDVPTCELKISDSGTGIEEEDMKKIFEPFYTTKEKGTGLGLAIVNRIVEAAGGSILVFSTPSTGTTFKVILPASRMGER